MHARLITARQCRRRQRQMGHGGLTANNDHTCGVEGRSVPHTHTHRGGVPETETGQLSNKRLHPKDGRITARLFSLLFNSVFSPQRQPNQMLTDTQRGWFLLCVRGLTAVSERQW